MNKYSYYMYITNKISQQILLYLFRSRNETFFIVLEIDTLFMLQMFCTISFNHH